MSILQQDSKQKPVVMYSALTLVLLIFILQASYSLVMNIVRNIDIYTKLQIVKKANIFALKKNKNLKYELQSFNSAKSLESIARNNLKMAGRNEILVIINHPIHQEKPIPKVSKEKGIFLKKH